MKIQFISKVWSDRPIDKPYRFFQGVFGSHVPTWHLIETTGSKMVAESIVFDVEPDFDARMLYESITPEMWQNTERSYRILENPLYRVLT